MVPYSIQTLKRLKPAWFRQELATLFDLLQETKIKPLIARRFPLAEARRAHELLSKGGVVGKIVLMPTAAVQDSERRPSNKCCAHSKCVPLRGHSCAIVNSAPSPPARVCYETSMLLPLSEAASSW